MGCRSIIAGCIGGFALICAIISLSTPMWQNDGETYFGLFKRCRGLHCDEKIPTVVVAPVRPEILAIAFLSVGIIGLILALAIVMLSILHYGKYMEVSGIIFVFSGLSITTAIITYKLLYTSQYATEGYQFLIGRSFVLACASAGFSGIASLVSFLSLL